MFYYEGSEKVWREGVENVHAITSSQVETTMRNAVEGMSQAETIAFLRQRMTVMESASRHRFTVAEGAGSSVGTLAMGHSSVSAVADTSSSLGVVTGRSYDPADNTLRLAAPWSEMLGPQGIPRGAVSCLSGSRQGLLGVVAAASVNHSVALVGFPAVGWSAAVEMGACSSNLIWVPHPGSDVAGPCMILAAGFDLVVADFADFSPTPQRCRTYESSLRHSVGTLIAVDCVWPQTALAIHTSQVSAAGLQHGYGRIATVTLDVAVSRRYQQTRRYQWSIGRNHYGAHQPVQRLHSAGGELTECQHVS